MMKSSLRPASAFSLVLSLIILTLLSILVIGFISSTAFDRTTAHAFANKTRAELAADTAVNSALTLIAGNIAEFPDSATVWESLAPKGGGDNVEGTMLYYSDTMPNDPKAQKHILPLLSTGVDANDQPLGQVPIAQKADALGAEIWDDNNSIDLNHARFNGDVAGWMGSPPLLATDPQRPKARRAKWIEVKDQPASGQTARTVGRYAFWVEDESFKVDMNLLGKTKRGPEISGKLSEPADIPFQGLLRNAYSNQSNDDRDLLARQVFDLRNTFAGKRLPDLRSFNQIESGRALGDESKFYGTIFSGGLNLSRHGSQRLNLNGLGLSDATTGIPPIDLQQKIQKQVQQLVETIRYHTKPAGTVGAAISSDFGERFYRSDPPPTSTSPAAQATYSEKLNDVKAVPASDREIYLYKIAANIRDYIDSDYQPTIVLTGGKVAPIGVPDLPFPENEGPERNEVWAQGKDSAPYLQEAIARYRSKVAGSSYELQVDYYLEFWNMSTTDVYADSLGSNPFVRVSTQLGWSGHKGADAPLQATNSPTGDPQDLKTRDLDIFIGPNGSSPVFWYNSSTKQTEVQPRGVHFKPGSCTVITTDPNFDKIPVSGIDSPAFSGGYNRENIYYCSNLGNRSKGLGKRFYSGTLPTGAIGIKPIFRNGTVDYEAELFMANDSGYLESQAAPFAHGGSPLYTADPPPGSSATERKKYGNPRDDWYGGTLLGNGTTISQLGDPRTNNEALIFTRFNGSTGEPDQSRYFNTTAVPRFTVGYPNDVYVNPSSTNIWPDYYRGWSKTATGEATNPDATNAPVVIANAPITSIGQLGDVFDPARLTPPKGTPNSGTLGITGSRGGGRTLRIGQHDDLVDMTKPNALSRQWASWRLADCLSISGDIQLPGLININGLRRDNGAALRAACYGLTLKSLNRGATANAPAAPSDRDLNIDEKVQTGLQKLIVQATSGNYDITKPTFSPFMERGELSELDLFSKGSDLLSGVNMPESFDRSREELFRRLVELTTTRGSIFSVYALGQSIIEGPPPQNVKKVTGTHQIKVTFQLVPKKANGTDFGTVQGAKEDFNPTTQTEVETRFDKPDHYDIRILQVSS